MFVESRDDETSDQMVNRGTAFKCDVCDSRHAFRNLRGIVSANKGEDKLNPPCLDLLPLAIAPEHRFDALRINELCKNSFKSPPLKILANHTLPHSDCGGPSCPASSFTLTCHRTGQTSNPLISV